jgi:hypothetical protein
LPRSLLRWFRALAVIFVLLVSACGRFGPQEESDSTIPSSAEAKATIRALDTDGDGKIIVQGLVVANDRGCEVDVSCVLRISSNNSEFNVVYHYGEWPPCENAEATKQGFGVVTGDRVEVHGAITASGDISTCDSTDFYVRKIDVDSRSIPPLDTTITPNPTLIHALSSNPALTRLPSTSGAFDARIEDWNDFNRDGQPDMLVYYNMLGTGSGGSDQAHLAQVDRNGELVELTEPIYNDFHLAPYIIENFDQYGILEPIVAAPQ